MQKTLLLSVILIRCGMVRTQEKAPNAPAVAVARNGCADHDADRAATAATRYPLLGYCAIPAWGEEGLQCLSPPRGQSQGEFAFSPGGSLKRSDRARKGGHR